MKEIKSILYGKNNILDIINEKKIFATNIINKYNSIYELPYNLIIKKIYDLRNKCNNLFIIVPQYQTNICIDDCKYCGFRKSNKLMVRKTLSNDEFIKELNLLLDWGYRAIELVYSTDPGADANSIAKRIELALKIAKKRNSTIRIGLNANVFSYNDYKTLVSSGLDFFVVWMETYNKSNYLKWHSKGTPKYNFEYRLESYERAIEAGLTNYGMGILFGLSDWKEDITYIINHAYYLEKKYNIPPYIFGIPRLKNTQILNSENIPNAISDSNYLFAINLYRLIFPSAKLFFNTREDFLFNINNIEIGGDLFTIDCATFPGAYLNSQIIQNGFQQFETFYYERENTVNRLKSLGFNLKYNW